MTSKTETEQTSPSDLWAETRQLYEDEGLPLSEIARQLHITKQGVHYRLEHAGVEMRPRGGGQKLLARQPLEKLYVVEKMSVAKIAAELGVSKHLVTMSLRRYKIEIRKSGRVHDHVYSDIRSLKVGESVVLPRPNSRGKWQYYFYYAAAKWGFKISVNAVGEKEARVTRLA